MAGQTIKSTPIVSLLINPKNPRYNPQANQREALATLALEQEQKLLRLAQDIAYKGLNLCELPIVTPAGAAGEYLVLEGNRRIAALKLMTSPQLLASIGLSKRLENQFKELSGSNLPVEVSCTVMSWDDAKHWIHLRHTGENKGVGIVQWDGTARHRFRGMSPALQAIDLVAESPYLDEETKKRLSDISITNIERILGTPEARRVLGVEVKGGELIIDPSNSDALARLAMVVSDIAERRKKVRDLDSKQQRVDYVKEVASRDIPPAAGDTVGGAQSATNKSNQSTTQSASGARRLAPKRATLIPQTCKLTIPQTRINQIYHELLKLKVDDYPNSCAVLLRVFTELSIDHYAQKKSLSLKIIAGPKRTSSTKPPVVCPACLAPLPPSATAPSQPPKDMPLREKIQTVFQYMENQAGIDKHLLTGVKSLHSNRNHILSVDGLNAYIHNKDYSPTPTDLKANWDSIQPFIEKLWA